MNEGIEYRIERLRAQLAHGSLAELGLRIEARGGTVRVTGTVADSECRDTVMRVITQELSGLDFLVDVAVAPADRPICAEEL